MNLKIKVKNEESIRIIDNDNPSAYYEIKIYNGDVEIRKSGFGNDQLMVFSCSQNKIVIK
jgi:hypothetical protein